MNKRPIRQLGTIALGIITIFSLLFSFYSYYNEKIPKLGIAKIGEINVLEINRNLDELQILYNDVDIKNSGNNIMIITFRIENKGSVNIMKGLFDDNLDWGIEIKNGDVLQARLINSNNKYIIENLEVSILHNKIIFSKVILEKNTFFDIEIILLNHPDISPEYFMIGKIAGIDTEKIEVLSQLPSTDKNYIQKIIDDNILVHIGRFFFYLIILVVFIIIIILIVLLIDKVGDLIKKRKRENKIASLSDINTKGKYFTLLSRFYIDNGIGDIHQLLSTVLDKSELRKYLEINHKDEYMPAMYYTPMRHISYNKYIVFLQKNGILTIKGDTISIDDDFISEINVFIKNIK
jgi:hypothetical protein